MIFVNFNLNYNNNSYHFISKELPASVISEFILNFYGELKIGRINPKELDIIIITYSEDDKKQIELELLNI